MWHIFNVESLCCNTYELIQMLLYKHVAAPIGVLSVGAQKMLMCMWMRWEKHIHHWSASVAIPFKLNIIFNFT